MTAFLAGDEQALADLLHRHFDDLAKFLLRRVRNDYSRAEDLAQETFIKVLRYAKDFDPTKAKFRTWLFFSALQIVKTEYKAENRQKRFNGYKTVRLASCQDNNGSGEGDREWLPDHRERGVLAVSDREQASRLQAYLLALQPELREALDLIYFQDLTYPQASEQSGVHIETLKKRVQRGLRSLRTFLEPDSAVKVPA